MSHGAATQACPCGCWRLGYPNCLSTVNEFPWNRLPQMRAPVPPPPPPPRTPKLMAMSRQQLVDLFEKLSTAEGEAYAYFETAKASRYFMRRRAVVSELRHRGTDERSALYALYSHRHPWVRKSVATSTYALN